jgi:hypothetical protein
VIDDTRASILPPKLDPRGPHEKRLNLNRLKKRVEESKQRKLNERKLP